MKDHLKIVVAMLIWSTWGLMIRWIGLPPVVILFYTALIASAAVPLVLKARGEFDLTGVAAAWPLFAVLAVGSIINNITYFFALANTTVSNAVFTHYTAPLFVAVLGGLAGVAGRSGSEGYMCGDDSKSIRKERGQAAVQEVPTLRKGRTPLFRALLKDSE